jgi:hypothetical protein
MHFATRVRTWDVDRLSASKLLYSEVALFRKPFGIGHVYIYTSLLRMTDIVTFQNIDLSSWDVLYFRKINSKSLYLASTLQLTVHSRRYAEMCLPSRCLETDCITRSIAVCVYGAVAWQCVNQIRYSIILRITGFSDFVHRPVF